MAELEWLCSCGETRPPEEGQYFSLIRSKEHKGHAVTLVDKDTGEVLAKTSQDAISKGLIPKQIKEIKEVKEAEVTELEVSRSGETYFPVKIWLPSSIFSLYYNARRSQLSNHKTLVDFLCEYCERGFRAAHGGYGLTLAQVEESKGDDKIMEKIEAMIERSVKALIEKGKVGKEA